MRQRRNQAGFTLIELLVVISILGILAAITVPALKNIGKGQAMQAATRQMLDDVARARQLAMSQRTTVYMVFVPTNFWLDPVFNALPLSEKARAQRLLDKQLTSYVFVSLRSVGDQPGQATPRYLSAWRTLPDGTFIAREKFATRSQFTDIVDAVGNRTFRVYGFDWTNSIPFPSEDAPYNPGTGGWVGLPGIAFNYLGQLVSRQDELIPLARGSVGHARDADKVPIFGPPTVLENPPGNSTNTFNLIRIDWLTGRARVERQEVQ